MAKSLSGYVFLTPLLCFQRSMLARRNESMVGRRTSLGTVRDYQRGFLDVVKTVFRELGLQLPTFRYETLLYVLVSFVQMFYYA